MVQTIKEKMVMGVINKRGKCPACKREIISRDDEQKGIFHNIGFLLRLDTGETYVKCNKCGNIAMLPSKAA